MQQPAVTDAELVEALTRRCKDLPPPPSQSFTVHDDVCIFRIHPSELYGKYGGGADASGCVYFFSDQFTYQDGWKVAAGTQSVLDDGVVVGSKDTLVFHEGRWLPRVRWAMDEYEAKCQNRYGYYSCRSLRLYRLRRIDWRDSGMSRPLSIIPR